MKDRMKKGVAKYNAGVKTLRKAGAGMAKALTASSKAYKTGTKKLAKKIIK